MQRQIIGLYSRIAWKHKKLFWLALISGPSTLILERFVSPLAIAAIFQMIQNGTVTLKQVTWLILAYAAVQFYTQVIGYRVTLFAAWKMETYGIRDLSQMSFEHFMKKSARFYANEFQGSLVARASRFSNAFHTFWSTAVYRLLFLITTLIATFVSVSFISFPYMLVLLSIVIMFMSAAFIGNKRMRPKFEKRAEKSSLVTAQFSDSFSNIMAIKSEAGSAREIARTKLVNDELADADISTMFSFLKFSSFFASFIAMMKIAAIVAAVMLVESKEINAGVVYLLITYTVNLIDEIWNFNSFFKNYTTVLSDAREMVNIINMPDEVQDESTDKLVVKEGNINLSNINFKHEEGDEYLFSNFNLDIPAGQKVGLVGRSGSGKTSLVNLLLRFVDVESGTISYDKTSSLDVSQESLRQNIAFVSQDPLLFHRTIRENISYGNPSASEEQITHAAKQAHAWEFIQNLSEGLETLVGERGVKLSGGQRQRVAIARAMLKNAPILILDEATSALDSESEKLIQSALSTLMKGRTSIVIAHRLSTISELDRIIVLEKGEILEDGSHAELLKENGIYAKLWGHQSGGFIEE